VVLRHPPRNGSYCPALRGTAWSFRCPWLGPFDLQEEVGSFVDEGADPRERESNNPPVPLLFRTYRCRPSYLSNQRLSEQRRLSRCCALEWRAAPLPLRPTRRGPWTLIFRTAPSPLDHHVKVDLSVLLDVGLLIHPSHIIQSQVHLPISLVDEDACLRERRTTKPPASMATCMLIIVAWYVVHTIPDRSALTAILLKTRRYK
jgi:hypothetical protein